MPADAARVIAVVFVSAIALIVAFRLLSGGIKTEGLLEVTTNDGFSPARLQLLLATFGGAGFYLLQILETAGQSQFPAVPEELLLLLGASNSGYLAAKVYTRFF